MLAYFNMLIICSSLFNVLLQFVFVRWWSRVQCLVYLCLKFLLSLLTVRFVGFYVTDDAICLLCVLMFLQFILSSVPKVKTTKFDDFCSLAWRTVGSSFDHLRKVGHGGKM
jgi:hypothetical protein